MPETIAEALGGLSLKAQTPDIQHIISSVKAMGLLDISDLQLIDFTPLSRNTIQGVLDPFNPPIPESELLSFDRPADFDERWEQYYNRSHVIAGLSSFIERSIYGINNQGETIDEVRDWLIEPEGKNNPFYYVLSPEQREFAIQLLDHLEAKGFFPSLAEVDAIRPMKEEAATRAIMAQLDQQPQHIQDSLRMLETLWKKSCGLDSIHWEQDQFNPTLLQGLEALQWYKAQGIGLYVWLHTTDQLINVTDPDLADPFKATDAIIRNIPAVREEMLNAHQHHVANEASEDPNKKKLPVETKILAIYGQNIANAEPGYLRAVADSEAKAAERYARRDAATQARLDSKNYTPQEAALMVSCKDTHDTQKSAENAIE